MGEADFFPLLIFLMIISCCFFFLFHAHKSKKRGAELLWFDLCGQDPLLQNLLDWGALHAGEQIRLSFRTSFNFAATPRDAPWVAEKFIGRWCRAWLRILPASTRHQPSSLCSCPAGWLFGIFSPGIYLTLVSIGLWQGRPDLQGGRMKEEGKTHIATGMVESSCTLGRIKGLIWVDQYMSFLRSKAILLAGWQGDLSPPGLPPFLSFLRYSIQI